MFFSPSVLFITARDQEKWAPVFRSRAKSICWSKSLSPKSSTLAGFALRPGRAHVAQIWRADALPGIEALQLLILFIDHPVDLAGAPLIGVAVDGVEQGFARSLATVHFHDEKILQEGDVRSGPGKGRETHSGIADGIACG